MWWLVIEEWEQHMQRNVILLVQPLKTTFQNFQLTFYLPWASFILFHKIHIISAYSSVWTSRCFFFLPYCLCLTLHYLIGSKSFTGKKSKSLDTGLVVFTVANEAIFNLVLENNLCVVIACSVFFTLLWCDCWAQFL